MARTALCLFNLPNSTTPKPGFHTQYLNQLLKPLYNYIVLATLRMCTRSQHVNTPISRKRSLASPIPCILHCNMCHTSLQCLVSWQYSQESQVRRDPFLKKCVVYGGQRAGIGGYHVTTNHSAPPILHCNMRCYSVGCHTSYRLRV